MTEKQVSRKNFIRNSLFSIASASIIPDLLYGNKLETQRKEIINMKEKSTYSIKNIRLETGFEYQNDNIIGTKTELFCIDIADGKIQKIYANDPNIQAIDANGLLMLPAFKDMHIHLDKTIYADKWQAVNHKGNVKTMIALEQELMPQLLKNSTFKAEKLIELLQSKGTSFARSHVNIETTSKLQSLQNLQIALANKKDSFGAELVIFPQHGLYYTDSLPYMQEAAKMNIDYIGALDPLSIDGSIERTMDSTIQMALDNKKGIDIHLHESGESGLKTIQYLIDKVNENPSLKGKTFISHSFVLSQLDNKQLQATAEQLANSQIGIISTVPLGRITMPIPTLLKHNVNVMLGNDSIVDHWNTFGTGSVLEKVNLAAQLYGQVSEFQLSRLLKLATAGPIPLNDDGSQQWPKVGNDANLILIDASCSAEAVARVDTVKSLIYNGNIVY